MKKIWGFLDSLELTRSQAQWFFMYLKDIEK